ncbi:MAG: adenylate/guanylate cyclase domain-containing protein [Thermodesulfobacteriota bacterium]
MARKSWPLLLLATAIVAYLTLLLLSIPFPDVFHVIGFSVFDPDYDLYNVYLLSVLILLTCSYLLATQGRLRHYQAAFSREREASEKLEKDVEILSSLLEVSSGINSQQKLSDILDTITREMIRCFRADRSSIMLLDEPTQTLKTEACSGVDAEKTKDARIPLGKGVSGWVMAHAQPLLINGQADANRFPGLIKKSSPIASSLCVPLRIAEKSIGVLNVSLMGADRSFSESDLKVLTIFANNAAVAIHNSMLQKEKGRRIRLQTMLGQLHSPQVVQKLVEKYEDGAKPTKMREKVELTVLFSDIRGFSGMLHSAAPEVIMSFLDEFYAVMNKAVFDNEGSIDKFIGDEVMAFFGAPIQLPNSSKSGLATAWKMQEYFRSLKVKFAALSPYFGELGLGIGINTGEVIVGNVGSSTRYEYTVIGNAVNLARRLCAYAEPGQILTTASTLELAGEAVAGKKLADIQFKGIPGPVAVFEVIQAEED